MKAIPLRIVLQGMLGAAVVLVVLTLSASSAPPCPASDSPDATEACSPNFLLSTGQAGPVAVDQGTVNTNAPYIAAGQLAVSGQLTWDDFKKLEVEAWESLEGKPKTEDAEEQKGWKDIRKRYSPYRDEASEFDELVRDIDADSETWKETQSVIRRAHSELRTTRDIYAYLAVYGDESQFRDEYGDAKKEPCDPAQENFVDGTVDRCNFAARMREATREIAYFYMIFGQEWLVKALDPWSAEVVGAEDKVREEIAYLRIAAEQFRLAQDAVAEGLDVNIGSGCYVADFYTQAEWALMARAIDGLQRAQHQIAVRKSYLGDFGPTQAVQEYQHAAAEQHVHLIGTVGEMTRKRYQQCPNEIVNRPDSDVIAEMVANMLDTQQQALQVRAGRNVFGYDVTFTPAYPLRSRTGSNVVGLFEQAEEAAAAAKVLQNDTASAKRDFDTQTQALRDSILQVKGSYDAQLESLTGCQPNQDDANFFGCIENVSSSLLQCRVGSSNYSACVSSLPNGQLREARDGTRQAYLSFVRSRQDVTNLFEYIKIEVERNNSVNFITIANTTFQSATQAALALIESLSVSVGVSATGPSVTTSYNPAAPAIADLRAASTLADGVAQAEINSVNSDALVRQKLVELSTLLIASDMAAAEVEAQAAYFQRLVAQTENLVIEAKRARAYAVADPANDPSYRMIYNGYRLQLATALERAARLSYLATKRAEYEYATSLSASGFFRYSAIYQARNADDIQAYLRALKDRLNGLRGGFEDVDLTEETYTISVAKHILGLTDEALGLTGSAAREERIRRFHDWVATKTVQTPNGPVLAFSFTTSLVDGGSVFADALNRDYGEIWVHRIAGVGQPRPTSLGVSANLLTNQGGNLNYRNILMEQSGALHQRSDEGCIFDYRLIHPAALMGYDWPDDANPETANAVFRASVNGSEYGQSTPGFYTRPVSASEWTVEVRAYTPDAALPDMDLQQLTDIELTFSTTRATQPAQRDPAPSDCVRTDF